MQIRKGQVLDLDITGIAFGAIAGSSLQTLTTAVAGDAVDEAFRGRAIGLLHTSGDLGSALGPLSAYALLPWIGLTGVYIICAGLFLLGFLISLVIGRLNPE